MDVRWTVIIRIDDDPESINSVDRRHTRLCWVSREASLQRTIRLLLIWCEI